MSSYENEFKFFVRVDEDIVLPKTPTKEENVSATRIDSVTDGVEFVPYWRTIKNDEITIIVNDALRLAILYVSASHYARDAYTWYDLGTIPNGYRPVRQFTQVAHTYGCQIKITPKGKVQYMSPVERGTRTYVASIVYPYFNNHVDPPE